MSKYIGLDIYTYVLRPDENTYFNIRDEHGVVRINQTVNPTEEDWDINDVLLIIYIEAIIDRYNKSITDKLYNAKRKEISAGYDIAIGKNFTSSDDVTWNAGRVSSMDSSTSLRVTINNLRDAHQLSQDLGAPIVVYKDINDTDREYEVTDALPLVIRETGIYVAQCYQMKHNCYNELKALYEIEVVDVNLIRNYDYTAKFNSIPNTAVVSSDNT